MWPSPIVFLLLSLRSLWLFGRTSDTNQYKAFSILEGINKGCLELELTFLQMVIYLFIYIFSS